MRSTHQKGASRHPLWNTWRLMLCRCEDPKDKSFRFYGARGISVCARWHVFENFASDVGERPGPGFTIDRYPRFDGNYEPGNVRWATAKQQAMNRRNGRYYTIGRETLYIAAWAARYGIKIATVIDRISDGWSPEAAITTPAARRLSVAEVTAMKARRATGETLRSIAKDFGVTHRSVRLACERKFVGEYPEAAK